MAIPRAMVCRSSVSRHEIRRSLRTTSIRQAVRNAAKWRTHLDRVFTDIMSNIDDDFTDEELEEILKDLPGDDTPAKHNTPGTPEVEPGIFAHPDPAPPLPPTDDELREKARFQLHLKIDKLKVEQQRQRQLVIERDEARKLELEQGLPFGSLMSEEVEKAPVSVSEAIRAYMEEKRSADPHMDTRTLNKHLTAFRFFLGLMGNMPLEQITAKVGREFYNQMLKSYTHVLSKPVPNPEDSCSTHPAKLFLDGNPEKDRVTPDAARKKAEKFSQFLDWAFNEYLERSKGFDLLGSVVKEKKRSTERINERRKPLANEQAEALLNHESMAKYKHSVGNYQVFWMAAVMAYSGCRNGEALWLTETGIKQDTDTGIYYFNFLDELETINGKEVMFRSVKGPNSVRKVPIHSQLIDWGILGYWEAVKADKTRTYLFNTRQAGMFQGHTDSVGTKVIKVLKELGVYEKNKVTTYSLRHRFVNLLKQMGLSNDEVGYFVGHIEQDDKDALASMPSTTGIYYANSPTLKDMQQIIERIP
jgi:integrase